MRGLVAETNEPALNVNFVPVLGDGSLFKGVFLRWNQTTVDTNASILDGYAKLYFDPID